MRIGREGWEQQTPGQLQRGAGPSQLHNLFVPHMHHRPEQGLTATAHSIPRSLKFKLFELGSGAGTALKAIASGVCERIGDPDGVSYLRVGAGWVASGAGRLPRCELGMCSSGASTAVPQSPCLLHLLLSGQGRRRCGD